MSRDRGQSFEAVPDAPYLVLLASSPTESDTFTMVGIDVQGVLHRSSDGLTWEAVGAVPLEPAAISVVSIGTSPEQFMRGMLTMYPDLQTQSAGLQVNPWATLLAMCKFCTTIL